jgi:hypothetical protein
MAQSDASDSTIYQFPGRRENNSRIVRAENHLLQVPIRKFGEPKAGYPQRNCTRMFPHPHAVIALPFIATPEHGYLGDGTSYL